MICVSASFAGKINDIINRERLRHDRIIKEMTKKETKSKEIKKATEKKTKKEAESNVFERYKNLSKHQIQNYQEAIKKIKGNHIKNMQSNGFANFVKSPPQAVIFVSFSMSDLSLKQIIQDASRHQVPVVIRGLYKDSFRKTVEKVFDLVKENNKGGILINPLWFRKYDIKAVPAVVVNNSNGNIDLNTANSFDVIYGNIPLKKILKLIVDRGAASKVAKNILTRGDA